MPAGGTGLRSEDRDVAAARDSGRGEEEVVQGRSGHRRGAAAEGAEPGGDQEGQARGQPRQEEEAGARTGLSSPAERVSRARCGVGRH